MSENQFDKLLDECRELSTKKVEKKMEEEIEKSTEEKDN